MNTYHSDQEDWGDIDLRDWYGGPLVVGMTELPGTYAHEFDEFSMYCRRCGRGYSDIIDTEYGCVPPPEATPIIDYLAIIRDMVKGT